MTSTVVDYSKYVGNKVTLTYNTVDDENKPIAVEADGTLVAENPIAVMFKPKGQTSPRIIEVGDIEQIVLAATGTPKLKAAKLKPVELGRARAHLLERHAYTLTVANALTEEDALQLHDETDHEAQDLGHVHVTKEEEEPAADSD